MSTINGNSATVNEAGVKGTNTAKNGRGVYGESKEGTGVWGWSQELSGVVGDSEKQYGVLGTTKAEYHGGVTGINNNDNSTNKAGPGVYGASKGTGVWGESETWMGIYGHSKSTIGGAGVMGENDTGSGIIGKSGNWHGVYGSTEGTKGNIGNAAVAGEAKVGNGIFGSSNDGYGVVGHSKQQKFAAVYGENQASGDGVFGNGGDKGRGVVGVSNNHTGVEGNSKNGVGIWGSGKIAAHFEGDVEVTGDIRLLNADFAEYFDIMEKTEPGEVMVLTESGSLAPSSKAYDKKVVGVISGAGKYKPGIILDNQHEKENRKPVAMMGKVYCKVDADSSPIEVGDLLTTSDIPGFAMKAIDPLKAFGAVIGKALSSLNMGKGLIPILVTLQ